MTVPSFLRPSAIMGCRSRPSAIFSDASRLGIPSCSSKSANPAFRCLPRRPARLVKACVITVTAMLNISNTTVSPITTSRVLSIVPPPVTSWHKPRPLRKAYQGLCYRNLVPRRHLACNEVVQIKRVTVGERQDVEHRVRGLAAECRIDGPRGLQQYHRRERAQSIVAVDAAQPVIERVGKIGSKVRKAVDCLAGSGSHCVQHPVYVLQCRD